MCIFLSVILELGFKIILNNDMYKTNAEAQFTYNYIR